MASSLLEIRNLTFEVSRQTTLDRLDLAIDPQEIHALLGANGSGKTKRGTSAYNLVLGERRAQAATQYLRDLGVPSSQMQITSYGKEPPFCAEHSEACWQSNRRAHFR